MPGTTTVNRFQSTGAVAVPASRGLAVGPIQTRSLDEMLALPRAAGRKHPHKDVLRLGGDEAGWPSTVYLKRQWAWDRRFPRWSDWRDGVARDPDPLREAAGIARLQALGLHVPSVLHIWRDPRPGSPCSALLLSSVPVRRSLADWFAAGDIDRLGLLDRRQLVVAVARTARRIHDHGLRWRSMKAKHIYPQHAGDGTWRIWLIDCEGVRPRATRIQQRSDRQLLLRSLAATGARSSFVASLQLALFA